VAMADGVSLMIVLLVAARGFSRSSSSSLLSMFLLAFRAYAHSSEPACGVLAHEVESRKDKRDFRGRTEKIQGSGGSIPKNRRRTYSLLLHDG
jgi:hypothetical protein